MSAAETQKNRNVANNANAVRVAADVASKSGNPYAVAAGKAVQVADKITGGKASEKLGKSINTVNKLSPGGRITQKAINRASESSTADRIGRALSKKKGPSSALSKFTSRSDSTSQDNGSGTAPKNTSDEQQQTDGAVSFKIPPQVIKMLVVGFASFMPIVVFMNLIIAATQTFLGVIGLDQADSVSSAEADKQIRDNGSEDLDKEITDDNVGDGITKAEIYIQDKFIRDEDVEYMRDKGYVFIANNEYTKNQLSELKDYYSGITEYEGHDMDTVYKFFFKLLYIERHYKTNYSIELDMPLIMSVLFLQSEDKSKVFISNIEGYKVSSKENNENFKYSNDWSNYIMSKNSSSHDVEILAQNMIKRKEGSSCYGTIDGACYEVVEKTEYRNFLKQFVEKKYFLKGHTLGKVTGEYKFVEEQNESNVNHLITQIYDLKEQYEDLVGKKVTATTIYKASSNLYWWPIGSKETEEINGVLYAKGEPQVAGVTSNYGSKEDFRIIEHGGLDIGNGGHGAGIINIIASKSGEVVYPTADYQTQYNDNGYVGNNDGGGYGNYVIIKHSDGSYTYYAHMAKNSITVRAGDVVSQGQVIGKMGHSGSSTGAHLHFEIRIGSDAKSSRVNPLGHVSPENPRPMSYAGGSSFSLVATTLSKEEFVARMRDYYNRTKKSGFYKNFLLNAEEVYDASVANHVNPELVVVTAGTEQNWTLSAACQYTNNYWGIGISNGEGCNAGGIYDSLSEGIAAYAETLSAYTEQGRFAQTITNRYNQRAQAGCDSSGHGLPGTFEGMQSVYSWLGNYRFNPGSWGAGGCKYLNIIYGNNYCSTVSTCASETATSNCPEESRTTVCEQNDYTAYQIKEKLQMRYDIFGL